MLLLAVTVVFFVIPRFGPLTLAVVALILLVLGVYQHISQFGTDYRLSTWQLGLMEYAPQVLMGGLILVIIFFLMYLLPTSSATTPNAVTMPTVESMPPAETSTNLVTGTINRALNTASNVIGANNKKNNNGGIIQNVIKSVNTTVNNAFKKNNNNTKNNQGYPFSQV